MNGFHNKSVAEIDNLINLWIFNQRNRNVVRRRLIDGIKFEELASEFDLSVSQVKRIVESGKNAILSQCW